MKVSSHLTTTMAKLKVLLLGATGETGESLLNGLLEDNDYVR